GERREGDHGANARDRLEPAHVLAQGAGEVREQLIDGAHLLPRLLPYRQVKADMACEFGNGGERGEEPVPARGTPQTPEGPRGPRRRRLVALPSAVWRPTKCRRRDRAVRTVLIAGLGMWTTAR